MLQQMSQFAAEGASKAEESEAGVAVLGLDPLAMLLQAGTFLLIFFIVRKYMLESIVNSLEQRRQTINEGIKNAEQIEEEKEKVHKELNTTLKRSHAEAADVIAKAHEEAGSIVAAAEEKATHRAETIVEQAKQQAIVEADAVRTELKQEMISLVANATETVLEEKIDTDADQKLVKRALESA